ncbi:MIP/aquaporin family protein [Chitinophaga sp. sic0106]|uniref:MIP/aquaporin family protein n=1 Tax=Chitinophaga sp. sic0106 TaxID=2854785 RepID=UPI001C438B7C|nr:MIP/aquaporin family protein [Chitinophaga sp. sic0106]MBV7530732.1 aquaporin family protein [Chitinophaga sp. sic0106]
MTPFIAEFLGTALLILLGNGVVANVVLNKTKGNGGGWIVITTGWALAVFTGVVVAGPVSGAHLNPAVTIGLAIAGKFAWAQAPSFIAAQMLGAMAGTSLVWLNYKDHYDNTPDTGLQRATFCTEPAIRNTALNLICEITGTFVLIFAVFYFAGGELGDNKEPIGMGSLGAIPVAFVVWVIGLSLGGTTGYAINPARDLGPRIMHQLLPIKGKGGSDWGYAWVPVLGPVIGASLAAALYLALQP